MTRNYRLFVAGQLVSLLGTWTRSVAQGWLVYRIAGSTAWLGIVAACQQLPIVALAPIGGALADRRRRRTILVGTQAAAMVLAWTLAALVWRGAAGLPQLVAIAVLGGVVGAIDMPTRQAFVVEMVGREYLPKAIAINSSMAMAAASLGPLLGGVGVDALGAGWCFAADGASFAAVIAALLLMRGLPAPAPPRRATRAIRFAWEHREIRARLGLLAIVAIAGLPYGTLFPALAGDDARVLGAMTAASGGGALLGAVLLARRRIEPRAAAAALGALLVAFAITRQALLLVPLGAATLACVSATNTCVQLATPDAMRGRVMAVYAMIVMGGPPLGALVAGAVGPTIAMAAGGAICVIAARTVASPRGTAAATPPAAPGTPR